MFFSIIRGIWFNVSIIIVWCLVVVFKFVGKLVIVRVMKISIVKVKLLLFFKKVVMFMV